MAWHAIDDIGDAIDATTALLTPFDWWVWLRLGVVVALVGGAGGGVGQLSNLSQFGSAPSTEGLVAPVTGAPAVAAILAQVSPGGFDPDMLVGPGMILLVAFAVVALVALVLLASIGTTMEFVIVRTLRRERVAVGADFGANYGNGVRLALFRFGTWALALGVVGAVAVSQLGADPTAWTEPAILSALVPLVLSGIGVFLVVSLINGFTTVFVVPIMLVEERALLPAWRRLIGSMSDNVGQYLLYLVVSVLLGIGVSIVLGFGVLLALIAVAIPTGLVTLALFVLLSGPVLWALGGVVVAVGVLAMIVAALFISVPLVVFLRYYALFVLGDVEPAVDPIADVRAAVREPEEPAAGS